MSKSRKRRGASVHTPPRRRMLRDDEVKNLSLMRAITAAVVVVAAVASGVAHTMHHPSIRRTVHEPKRLVWEEHVEDLEERDCFKRMYRMPQESFGKLAALLAPILQVNSYYFAGWQRIAGATEHGISGNGYPTTLECSASDGVYALLSCLHVIREYFAVHAPGLAKQRTFRWGDWFAWSCAAVVHLVHGASYLCVCGQTPSSTQGGFLALAAVEASSCVSQSPIVNLMDSAVRHSFGSSGYGRQRLWGAVGHGLATFTSGVLYDTTSGRYGGVVVFFVGVSAVAVVTAFAARIEPNCSPVGSQDDDEVESLDMPPDKEAAPARTGPTNTTKEARKADKNGGEGDKRSVATEDQARVNGREEHGVLRALWVMFSTPDRVSFFLTVVLSGMSKGVINTFLFIWLTDLGGSHALLGLAGLVTSIAELPFFYLSGPLIRAIGSRNVVALAQIGYLLRFVYYSVLRDPWWVLPAEMLHGLTFAAMWAATIDYAHGIAPAHLRSTVQAIVSGLKRGLGCGLGSVLGGVMYSSLGPRVCFGVSAALPCLSILLLLVIPPIGVRQRYRGDESAQEGLDTWAYGSSLGERRDRQENAGKITEEMNACNEDGECQEGLDQTQPSVTVNVDRHTSETSR